MHVKKNATEKTYLNSLHISVHFISVLIADISSAIYIGPLQVLNDFRIHQIIYSNTCQYLTIQPHTN